MHMNRTSESKVLTIWTSRDLPLFNFERREILCACIGHPSEKLWPFEFLERFRCSISSVSIYYVPEWDIRVKSYDHLNFLIASVVQLRASWNIMRLNRTSELKVMTFLIPRELSLFNFERLDLLCALIRHSSEKLWPFEFLESFRCSISSVSRYYVPKLDIQVKSYDHLNFSRASVVQFWVSRYIISPNRTSEWKVMTIWISWELPLFKFECLDILCPRIRHPCEKLWPIEFLESFRCSMSSVPIYYAPESDIRVRSYNNLNFSRAFVVQFRVSQYIIHLNRKPEWKVMTIWISRELPLFNVERPNILCAWIGHPS